MKTIPEIKKELRNILLLGGIKDTFLSIKKFLPEHAEKFTTLLLLEGRYRDFERSMLQGIMSSEDGQLETNKIRAGLLSLIDGLEEADFQEKAAKPADSPKAQSGKILYRIPDSMQVNEETKCIIRVAFTEEVLLENLEIESIDHIKSIRVSEAMAAQIIDPNEKKAFSIRAFSEEIQFVEEDYYTEWLFYVRPLLEGTFSLLLKVSVIEIKMGKERKRDIVMEEKVVITTEAVEEEPFFKSAKYDFVSAYAPISTQGIEPTPMPSIQPAPAKGVGRKVLNSIASVLLIIGVSIAAITGLNKFNKEVTFPGVDENKGGMAFNDLPTAPEGFPKDIDDDPEFYFPEASSDLVSMDMPPSMMADYKKNLQGYVDQYEGNVEAASRVAEANKKIEFIEIQEALSDKSNVELIDYLGKYEKNGDKCMYCDQAKELKLYKEGISSAEMKKLDVLLKYLKTYPNGKYKLPAIESIEKIDKNINFPPVFDALKWDTEQLKLNFLQGTFPLTITSESFNMGDSSSTPLEFVLAKPSESLIIPFKVPDLQKDHHKLTIIDSLGRTTIVPLHKMKVKSVDEIKPLTDVKTDPGSKTTTEPSQTNPIAQDPTGKGPSTETDPKNKVDENPTSKQNQPDNTTETNGSKTTPSTPVPTPTEPEVKPNTGERLDRLSGEILVKKGWFQMGNEDKSTGKYQEEQPAHGVTIRRDFYMQQTETTFNSYDAYCSENNVPKPSDESWGRGDRPVINVSWLDAVKYCNWLTSKYPQLKPVYDIKENGKVTINNAANGFRLPSEAEWEYAARGGHRLNKNHKYAGSVDDWESVAYKNDNHTGRVKSKKPNALNLYDMSGNVYEWTQDYWVENYNNTPKDGSAYSQRKDYGERTIRGGRFNSDEPLFRVSHRAPELKSERREGVGFRVVRFAD